jgi:hypothetical protein
VQNESGALGCAGRCRASGCMGRRGARGDQTGAPAGSVGDRLLSLGDGPTLGDV